MITVYPKALLKATAYSTARFVLLGGMLSLLLELLILYLVLKKQVAAPLGLLLGATKKVASGDMNVALDESRNDELGELATSFNQMAQAVLDREERNRLLAEEIAENLKREIEKNELLERLRNTVDVLSTPVLEVWKQILSLPLVGAIDDRRSEMMIEKVLRAVAEKPCRYVIIDINGVPVVDSATAGRLLKLAAAVKLLGARCVLTGIGPSVAQTLVSLRVPMHHFATLRTMKDALRACLKRIEGASNVGQQ